MTDLFRKQTVHDKEHNPLKAAKDGEEVRHGYCALLKLETTKDPHGAQHTELSHCSNGECPAGESEHGSNLRHTVPQGRNDFFGE